MRMPVLFVGHGSPMNAIASNRWTKMLAELGNSLPKPRAILCVSAHWETKGTKVLTVERPKTIHDFQGFPPELYDIQYPAQGSPELAEETLKCLRTFRAQGDVHWGLDHGTWSVLLHMYPKADVPVIQVSLDMSLNEKAHVEIGKALRSLREEGVLILGSGNIVHNLRLINWKDKQAPPAPWNLEFDEAMAKALDDRDENALIFHKQNLGEASVKAVPTDEHFIPLLYCFGASDSRDQVTYPYTGYDMGSLSMRSVLWQ